MTTGCAENALHSRDESSVNCFGITVRKALRNWRCVYRLRAIPDGSLLWLMYMGDLEMELPCWGVARI